MSCKISGIMCKRSDIKAKVPWWTEGYRMAFRVRNRLLSKVRNTFSFDGFILYKRAQANVRKMVRTAKRSHWREKVRKNVYLIGRWVGSRGVIIFLVLQSFVKVHSNENISNDMRRCREENLRK